MQAPLGIRSGKGHMNAMESAVDTLIAGKTIVVAALFVLLFTAERLLPAARTGGTERPMSDRHRLGRNVTLWLANVALSLAIVVPVSNWAVAHSLGFRPVWWSGGAGLLLDLLLLDFLIYWWHRANHVVPLLWRFHEIHHLDRFLDTTTSVRFHFGEVALSALARAGVILLFGIPLSSVLAFEALVLAAALFHHSNLRLPAAFERALSRIVITPSIHWVHHHRRQADTDSNYGTVLSIWDPLFRTRSATKRSPDMEIGVQANEEQTLPRLILRPFVGRSGVSQL